FPHRSYFATTVSLSSNTPYFFYHPRPPRALHSFPTRRSSDLHWPTQALVRNGNAQGRNALARDKAGDGRGISSKKAEDYSGARRSEEHTSELQSLTNLVCRLLLAKKTPHHTTLPLHHPHSLHP